ncbi:MAG: hypothetical protein ACREPT_05025, partial [Rudaea sp.]
ALRALAADAGAGVDAVVAAMFGADASGGGATGGAAWCAALAAVAVAGASGGAPAGAGDMGLDTIGSEAGGGCKRRASAMAWVVLAAILAGAAAGLVAALVAILPSTGADCECNHHQPPTAAIAIARRSHGRGLRRRRRAVNGVPRSGAPPRRRCASDFFKASRINDMSDFR